MYTVSGIDNDTRQLQFWNPVARQYEPSAHQGNLDPDTARVAAFGRPWRIAKAERPLKPPAYRAGISRSSGRTVADVCDAYMGWAIERGLKTVTLWRHQFHFTTPKFTSIRRVDPVEYFTVDQHDEPDSIAA